VRARWIRAPLGELTSKIGSGATPSGGEAAYEVDGITLNRSLNVHDGEFPESLQEQARIVAILDEAFKGIATAEATCCSYAGMSATARYFTSCSAI
jgi:hypothetical protein